MPLLSPALVPLAYVTRSGFVEGVHHGSAVALDATGGVLARFGDPARPVLPRSCLKPLQAVAMLREGLELDGELLALAAASHSGEAYHRDGVIRLLASAGLEEASLGNVPDLPLGAPERLRWQQLGLAPSRLAMNCSGKHAAMLVTCTLNDWPTASYLEPAHPLQRRIAAAVEHLAGEPVAATAVDGCGTPALAISLTGLARAFGLLATADPATPEGAVSHAIRTHPEWLGGTERDVTELLRAVPGLIAKDGAESVYAAALPDGRAVAMKIADGSERARQVVMAGLLRGLGVPGLEELASRPVFGGGRPAGRIWFAGE